MSKEKSSIDPTTSQTYKKVLPPFLFKCRLRVNFLFLFNCRFSILRVRFVNYTLCQLLMSFSLFGYSYFFNKTNKYYIFEKLKFVF